MVNYGSINVKVRVQEVDGRLFQSSTSSQENDFPKKKSDDEDNGDDEVDGEDDSEEGDFFESSDEDSSVAGTELECEESSGETIIKESTQFPRDITDSGEKTAEKVDGHFEIFNDEVEFPIINDGNITRGKKVVEEGSSDPNKIVAHNEKETDQRINVAHEQNNASPIKKTQVENCNNQLDESPKLLNGVSERLKILLSRDTPIKDKINGEKWEVKEAKERMDSDNTANNSKWSMTERRITRSQSRKIPHLFPKSEASEIGSFSSDSSKMSTNVSHRLEETGRKNGFKPGRSQEKVHGKKNQKGESKGNP
ncbi:hypothetical protein L1887_14065 [Cichorium endivia]|nr:hypothetical protein L1887_14065 [Cichorium endivia]